MHTIEKVNTYLEPAGKSTINLVKEDITFLSSHINEDEDLISATTGSKKLTYYLYLLTSERLLTLDKDKRGMSLISYDLKQVKNLIVNRKLLSVEVHFEYSEEKNVLKLTNDNSTKAFSDELENLYGVPMKVPKKQTVKRKKKAIKMKLNILNGKEQLNSDGLFYNLEQSEKGYIDIIINNKEVETFKIIKWERVENIQKSAFDIAGWSVIGSAFGNAGTIAGAMGANIGKDKSVATLFLKRENGEKVPLVIKCDQKDLEKLSLLIVADEEEISLNTNKPSTESFGVPTEELIKLKELLDLGILTQEEFEAKKKQILNL